MTTRIPRLPRGLGRGRLRSRGYGHRAGSRGREAVRAHRNHLRDLDLVEITEASAVQVLAVYAAWGLLDPDKLNVP